MALSGAVIRLHGMTVIDIPPFGVAHVEFRDGAQVLYGRNASGKTRLLQAVRDGLRGHAPGRGRILLHGRMVAAETIHSAMDDLRNRMNDSVQALAHESRIIFGSNSVDMEFVDQSGYLTEYLISHVAIYAGRGYGQPGIDLLSTEYREWEERELSDTDYEADSPTSPEVVLIPTGAGSAAWDLYIPAPMRRNSDFRTDFWARATAVEDPTETPGLFRPSPENADAETWGGFLDYAVPPSMIRDASGSSVGSIAEAWPEWAGIPLLRVAEQTTVIADQGTRVLELGDGEVDDLDAFTRRLLAPLGSTIVSASDDETVLLDAAIAQVHATTETRANELLRLILPTASPVRFRVGTPDDWFRGRAPAWESQTPTGALPLEALSWTERRWTVFAIRIALEDLSRASEQASLRQPIEHGMEAYRVLSSLARSIEADLLPHSMVLIDEPELGLHRAAEANIPRILAAMSADSTSVLAASHSPALVGSLAARPIRVWRDLTTGMSGVSGPTGLSIDLEHDLLEGLGLTKGDVFLMSRVFVLVEGLHDQVVLEELVPSVAEAPMARLLPMRGARNMKAALMVPYLFEYSEANVVLVLDNLGTAERTWNEFRRHLEDGDTRAARRAIDDIRSLDGGEAQWLAEFAHEAMQADVVDRIRIVGLSRPDIVCYLPIESIAPGIGRDWDDVIAEWRRSSRRPVDIKSWLKERTGRAITERTIRQALLAMRTAGEPLHPDLAELEAVVGVAMLR